MAEFQELLDFPPAPGLGIDGKLDPKKFGAGLAGDARARNCSSARPSAPRCHPAPYYTDNSMHDLKVERFYKTQTINGLVATQQGPIKTFPLRGIKESPPYLHDGRLLTLEDTVEFFNLVLETKLTPRRRRRWWRSCCNCESSRAVFIALKEFAIRLFELIAGAALVAVVLYDVFQSVVLPRRTGSLVRLAPVQIFLLWPAWRWIGIRLRRPGAVKISWGRSRPSPSSCCWSCGSWR